MPTRRCALLIGLLVSTLVVPAAPAAANTDYQQVLDLTFPFTEGTSVFWPDTYDASRGGGRHHQATDMLVDDGTPVHAVTGGVVTGAGHHAWGYAITIQGTDDRTYVYLHLGRDDRPAAEAIAAEITDGAAIERGQLIGYAGCSGDATCGGGEHLHLEIHDDRVVDPYDYHDDERINPYPSLQAAVERGDYPGAQVATMGAFTDVEPDSLYADDIVALVDAGVTDGCAEGRFCPADGVTRAQMASFLVRALDLPAGEGTFDDVAADSDFAADIAALAGAGITQGCDEVRFCPDQVVPRAQMASFLVRAGDLPAGEHDFTDVAADSPFAADIASLADAEVTRGCNPPDNDRFCPQETVTRAQMASFLVRTFLTG